MAPHAGGTLQGPDKSSYCSSDLTEWGEKQASKSNLLLSEGKLGVHLETTPA